MVGLHAFRRDGDGGDDIIKAASRKARQNALPGQVQSLEHDARQRGEGTQKHHRDEPDDEQRDDGRQLRMRHLLTGFACRTAETALPDAKDGHDRGEQQHSGEFDDDKNTILDEGWVVHAFAITSGNIFPLFFIFYKRSNIMETFYVLFSF